MNSRERHTGDDSGLDLIALAATAWRHRAAVLVSCFLCTAAALAIALLSTPIYRAELILRPVRDSGMGENSSGLADQLGGLASLAGVNLPDMNSEEEEGQAVLDSNRLAREFIERYHLVPVLSKDPLHPMDLWHAARLFKKSILTIKKDERREVTIVGVEWTDPHVAARWANDFVSLGNELMRERARTDATGNVAYLNEELEKTNVLDMRRALYSILENETRKLMLVNGRTEYAFEVIDPAVAPEIRARPQRTLIVSVGLGLGLFAGVVAALILDRLGYEARVVRAGRLQTGGADT